MLWVIAALLVIIAGLLLFLTDRIERQHQFDREVLVEVARAISEAVASAAGNRDRL